MEAQPLLADAWTAMARTSAGPPQHRQRRIDAATRLVELYSVWEKPEELTKWRKELKQLSGSQAQ